MIQDTRNQDTIVTPSRSKHKWLTALFVVLALMISAALLITQTNSAEISINRDSVKFAVVTKGDLLRDIVTTGRIIAANAPQLYSPEQGYVMLNVKPGDRVVEGQVVALVDAPELQNTLQQELSELTRLKSDLARQELDVRRQTLLLNKQADLAKVELVAAEREEKRAKISIKDYLISQIDLEEALDNLAKAKVIYKHALSEVALVADTLAFELAVTKEQVARQALVVDELTRQMANLHIRASVSGLVGNVLIQPNALVAKNEPLLTLVDLTAYEAQLQVAESYANELGLGMSVELKVGGQTAMGTLVSISPEVVDRQVITRVRFPEDSIHSIRQNQQVSARILLENKPDVLKVSRGSFLQAGGTTAYLVKGDIAERRRIKIGATSIREVEILSGLQEGEQIIVSNYEQFNQAASLLLR